MDFIESFEIQQTSPEINMQENFNQFLVIIQANLAKKKYKQTYVETISQEKIFTLVTSFWKLTEIKIKCILKIIKKKLFSDSLKRSNKSIDKWLKRCEDTLDEWSAVISDKGVELEKYVTLYLYHLYYCSVHLKNTGKFIDAMSLLALGERMIKQCVEKIYNPKILHISQLIFLFISSLLIADGCYEIAKQYIMHVFKLCMKEMYLRSDENNSLNLDKSNKYESYYFQKVARNLSLAFYHLGVCEENLNNLQRTWESFKQASWTARTFLRFVLPYYVSFTIHLEDKASKYFILLKTLHSENIKTKNAIDNKIHKRLDKRDQKLENIKLQVEGMEIKNIDENKESTKSEVILSTLNLTNKLLSNKFKDVIKDLKDLKLFHIKPETEELIKKKVVYIRNENTYNEIISRVSSGKDIKNSNHVTPTLKLGEDIVKKENKRVKNMSSDTFSDTNWHTVKKNKQHSRSVASSPLISLNLNNKNTVERHEHDYYVFSKKFKNKSAYFDNINKKEIQFQKKLLNMKKYQSNLPYPIKSLNEIDTEVDNFFTTAYINKYPVSPEDKRIEFKKDEKQDHIDKKNRLTSAAIRSLSTRKFAELDKLLREVKEDRVLLPKEEEYQSNKKTEKKKDKLLNDIKQKLGNIEYKQKECRKITTPYKFKHREYVPRKLIADNPCEVDIDRFVRKIGVRSSAKHLGTVCLKQNINL
jgi:hypothetical protein